MNASLKSSQTVTRRQLLQTAAACTVVGIATGTMTRQAKAVSANDKLNLAFVGIGGRGRGNLDTLASTGSVNVVSICDVNGENLDRVAGVHPQAKRFTDFRKQLENLNDVDGVVVSTAEHTHAFATLPALLQKKPVYCEKPLTHNIAESHRIMQAAKEAGVATQMGTQIHAGANYRRVVELIQSKAIGDVTEAHVWTSRAWGLQSKAHSDANGDIVYVTERPAEEQTPPPFLDWDLWIGPAPMRPYNNVYFPGPKWYRWWDFGSGTMSDLGSHMNDLPFWALKLESPKTIEAIGDKPHAEIAPASMTAIYEYAARGDMPACKVTWYQGTHKPQLWLDNAIPQWNSGVLFVGTKGMVLSDYGKHLLLPEQQFADFQRPDKFIPDSPGQHEEWLEAIRTGKPTGSPFSYAGLLTIANHLGNVAFRSEQKIEWDAANLRATNCPAADAFISRKPRAGWSLA